MKKFTIALIALIGLSVLVHAQETMQEREWFEDHHRQLAGIGSSTVMAEITSAASTALASGNLTGTLGSATTAVDTVVSGAALGATAVQPADVWGSSSITPSVDALTNTVAIQSQTLADGNLSERRLLRIWVSDSDIGAASTNNIESLVLSGGVAVDTVTANADYRYVTSTNGTVTATVTGSAAGTNYLMVADGGSVNSAAVVFEAGE